MPSKNAAKYIGTEADEVRRAMAAYFRSGETDQPSRDSAMYEMDGKRYVRLSNTRGTLAVYRVRNDGMLKRLRRWPSALDEV